MSQQVYIYTARADWSISENLLQLAKLPLCDQSYSQRYTHPLRLRNFVASRLLLRQALTDLEDKSSSDWLFDYSGQRLQLNRQQTDWQTSLSHSEEWVACVLAKTDYCGIDIESNTVINPRYMAIARRFFHIDEYQKLLTLPESARFSLFLDFWTRKEACVKAWHRGLAHHLASISFQQSTLSPVSFPSEFAELPLTLTTQRHNQWQLACAVNIHHPEWIFREWHLKPSR
jgi:4'-phosphopantetheinyl transferase